MRTPWKLSHTDRKVRDVDGDVVFDYYAICPDSISRYDEARRIVAAVNAVEHLPTHELEAIVREGNTLSLALAWQTREQIQKASFA